MTDKQLNYLKNLVYEVAPFAYLENYAPDEKDKTQLAFQKKIIEKLIAFFDEKHEVIETKKASMIIDVFKTKKFFGVTAMFPVMVLKTMQEFNIDVSLEEKEAVKAMTEIELSAYLSQNN